MSAFGRAFLRLAACAALRDATLAGRLVFDSRIAAVDPETLLPELDQIAGTIGVYTEQDSGDALAAQNGGPPFRPEVELVLEIAMQARLAVDENTYEVVTPETDDQLEMTLDIIEGQAELALFRFMSPAAAAFRRLTKQVTKKTSIRFTDPKASAKLAIRYVTYAIEIEDPEIPIFDASLTGLNRLPEPWRSVALSWPAGSVERQKAETLAALLTAPPPPALTSIETTTPPPPSTQAPGTDPNPSRVETWNLSQ